MERRSNHPVLARFPFNAELIRLVVVATNKVKIQAQRVGNPNQKIQKVQYIKQDEVYHGRNAQRPNRHAS
jgi:hypothetical protein